MNVQRWICLVLIFPVTGCGRAATDADYGSLGLISVSGTVTLDGSPLTNATVRFEAHDRTYSSGVTDSSGHYSLQFNSEQAGVLPGSKVVRISLGTPEDADDSSDRGSESASESQPENSEQRSARATVPLCYNSDSVLTAEVDRTKNRFDFDLRSDCSTKGAK